MEKKYLKRCKKDLVIKDPVHSYIYVKHQIILELINTPEFQRLRHINQLGLSSLVYPSATHTRFSHSLGTYQIANKISSEHSYFRNKSYEKILFIITALIHDIGHGPISHSFETAMPNFHHEKMGIKIIKSKYSQINKILKNYDENLVNDICDLISKKSQFLAIQDLISSDIDVDRMDYLLRDSYQTSSTIGTFDLSRIIYTMKFDETGMSFSIHGLNVIEDFLLSRVHMYSQVYIHKKSLVLEKFMDMYIQKKLKSSSLERKATLSKFHKSQKISTFLKLTDHHIFELLINESNKSLVPIANAIINRTSDMLIKVPLNVNKPDLELLYDPTKISTKKIYNGNIKISINQKKYELSEVSQIIKLLNEADIKMLGEYKYYVKDFN